MLRPVVVGEIVHIHGFKSETRRRERHRHGWPGYVHNTDGGGTHYHISQRDPSCWASKFWIHRDEVFQGIWTFEGYLCSRCKEIIR